MKRLFTLLTVVLMTIGMMAQDKMSFIIEGKAKGYDQIRVVNQTSLDHIRCRLVVLDAEDNIEYVYGVYDMEGYDESDSNSNLIMRGRKIGIQMPEKSDAELTFIIEYQVHRVFNAVVVILKDKKSEFSDEF